MTKYSNDDFTAATETCSSRFEQSSEAITSDNQFSVIALAPCSMEEVEEQQEQISKTYLQIISTLISTVESEKAQTKDKLEWKDGLQELEEIAMGMATKQDVLVGGLIKMVNDLQAKLNEKEVEVNELQKKKDYYFAKVNKYRRQKQEKRSSMPATRPQEPQSGNNNDSFSIFEISFNKVEVDINELSMNDDTQIPSSDENGSFRLCL